VSALTRLPLPPAPRRAYSIMMDPIRLKPAVELPVRRARPLAMGAALAILFAFGARNYVASMHHCPYASSRGMVRFDFASSPPGATVVREWDGRALCITPCEVTVEAEARMASYRFEIPGYEDRRLFVDMSGGNTHVEAVLRLSP